MENALEKTVCENNEKINEMIQKIFEKVKNKREKYGYKGELEEEILDLFKLEIEKCRLTYEMELNKEIGKFQTPIKVDTNVGIGCFGGKDETGLIISENLQEGLNEILEKVDGESIIDEQEIEECEYIDSPYDMLDYFKHLKQSGGQDIDWIIGAIPHEVMHSFIGHTILTEGIVEELTREISQKYHMHMMPVAHKIETEFIRKMEDIVGREEIIKFGIEEQEKGEDGYERIGEIFEKQLGIQPGSFKKYLTILDGMCTLLTYGGNIKDFSIPKQIYEEDFACIDYTRFPWKSSEDKYLESIEGPLKELEESSGIKIKNYKSFINSMKGRTINEESVKINKNYKMLIDYQNNEIGRLREMLKDKEQEQDKSL